MVARARRIIEASDEIVALARTAARPAGRAPARGAAAHHRSLPAAHSSPRASGAKLPRIELLLYEYQTGPMLDHLQAGDIDLGILALPVPGGWPRRARAVRRALRGRLARAPSAGQPQVAEGSRT